MIQLTQELNNMSYTLSILMTEYYFKRIICKVYFTIHEV